MQGVALVVSRMVELQTAESVGRAAETRWANASHGGNGFRTPSIATHEFAHTLENTLRGATRTARNPLGGANGDESEGREALLAALAKEQNARKEAEDRIAELIHDREHLRNRLAEMGRVSLMSGAAAHMPITGQNSEGKPAVSDVSRQKEAVHSSGASQVTSSQSPSPEDYSVTEASNLSLQAASSPEAAGQPVVPRRHNRASESPEPLKTDTIAEPAIQAEVEAQYESKSRPYEAAPSARPSTAASKEVPPTGQDAEPADPSTAGFQQHMRSTTHALSQSSIALHRPGANDARAIPPAPSSSVAAQQRQVRESNVTTNPFMRVAQFGALGMGMGMGAFAEGVRRTWDGTFTSGGGWKGMILSGGNSDRLTATLCRMRGAALKVCGSCWHCTDVTLA